MAVIKWFKRRIYNVLLAYFTYKTIRISKRHDQLFIVDIDNTIANTWPSLLKKHKSEFNRLKNLPVYKKVVSMIEESQKKGGGVIFLTARDYRYFFVTRSWLIAHVNFDFKLVLVETPKEKVGVIKQLKSGKIYYYDDLSYAHESGAVKFYKSEIDEIKKLPNVIYYDYEFLKMVQGASDEEL